MMMAIASSLLISVSLLTLLCQGEFTQYQVPCDHSTVACVCPHTHNKQKVDVCIFSMVIDTLQTFMRYRIDPVTNQIALPHGGRVWYINGTTGDFLPYLDGRNVCDKLDSNCTEPYAVDGYSFRTFFSINGRIPGPTLIVNYNQTVVVNLTNQLDSESISIHWHGMNQMNTNWMDGVEHITQCGINSGMTFTYIFQAEPAGTHWYHSHSGSQRNEGVYGSLVVLEVESSLTDVKSKFAIDFQDLPQNHTLLFQDWQNADAVDILLLLDASTHYYYTNDAPDPRYYTVPQDTHTTDGGEVGPIPFWSGLINGKGRYKNVTYVKTRLSIFTVSPNGAFRFRLVGSQHVFAFRVSIDEHHLKVISTDGVFIKAVEVDYIIINPGERYDFILETKSRSVLDSKSDFMIRAETLEVYPFNDPNETLRLRKDHLAEGILHYDITSEPVSIQYNDIAQNSIPVENRCTADEPCLALNCPFQSFPPSYNITCRFIHELELLTPLPDDELPDVKPDEYLFFNVGFEGSSQTSSFNARNLKLPSAPLSLLNNSELEQLISNEYCKGLDDPKVCDNALNEVLASDCICTQVKRISYNVSVQMVLSVVTPHPEYSPTYKSSHPVHLHGHHFHVVDIQFGNYSSNGRLIWPNEDIDCGGDTLCTKPSWKQGRDYSLGKNGKISEFAPLKDTLTIPSGGYVVVYFQSDNPGFWYLHCNTEIHYLPGMGAVIAEATDKMNPPPQQMNQCGNFLWNIEDYYDKLYGDGTQDNKTQCLSIAELYATSICLFVVAVIIIILIIGTIGFMVHRKISVRKKDITVPVVNYKSETSELEVDL